MRLALVALCALILGGAAGYAAGSYRPAPWRFVADRTTYGPFDTLDACRDMQDAVLGATAVSLWRRAPCFNARGVDDRATSAAR